MTDFYCSTKTVRRELSLEEKLHILADAAKYDVSCTSSGSSRRGKTGYLGNSVAAGICHSFSADGRCISLLKNSVQQRMYLRLPLLRQPPLQRPSPGHLHTR